MNNKFKKFNYPYITDGFVLDTSDPLQMGRLKIWCPAIDGEFYNISHLPWAEYCSPFAGITNDFPAGPRKQKSKGPVAYGFFALPKLNAQVLVFLLNGDPNRRFYMGSFFDHQRNRSLPAGRNITRDRLKHGPFTDLEERLEPEHTNLKIAFGIKDDDYQGLANPLAQQLGSFERTVAQAQTNKDGLDGYAQSAADPENYKDPQTYCWITPGHHKIIMNDGAADCKVRISTCEGHQILMDDTNNRIYIQTALGNNWIELSGDGQIFIYSGESVSVHAEKDFNVFAGRNINLEAEKMVNIKSGAETRITAGNTLHLKSAGAGTILSSCEGIDFNATGDFKISSDATIHIKAGSNIIEEGAQIHLNGPSAAKASCSASAYSPSIIPEHELWARPNVDKEQLKTKTPQLKKS